MPSLPTLLLVLAASSAPTAPELASPEPPPAAEAARGALDLETLLRQLARPAPAHTRFFEVRTSRLLSEPLLVRGRLSQPAEGELRKQVEAPFVEDTRVDRGRVEVRRGGQAPRRFSLARAPELEGLLASFSALLHADAVLLQRHYEVAISGGPGAWSLQLHPRDARLARRVHSVRMSGAAELHCLQLRLTDGGRSTLVVGERADALPDEALVADVLAQCPFADAP